MRQILSSILVAGALSIVSGIALSQPMMGPGGFRGQGPGMMGGGWGYSDTTGYLADLRQVIGITPAQGPAWDEYAAAVKSSADKVQGAHQTMFAAMGTATWRERRDMMNRMFDARQEAFDTVHAAAEKLLPALDAAQQSKAQTRLPGLASPGYGMMGRRGRWP